MVGRVADRAVQIFGGAVASPTMGIERLIVMFACSVSTKAPVRFSN